jgi:hypothetical protein
MLSRYVLASIAAVPYPQPKPTPQLGFAQNTDPVNITPDAVAFIATAPIVVAAGYALAIDVSAYVQNGEADQAAFQFGIYVDGVPVDVFTVTLAAAKKVLLTRTFRSDPLSTGSHQVSVVARCDAGGTATVEAGAGVVRSFPAPPQVPV